MQEFLIKLLALLNQINVCGEDVERLAVAKHMLRQLQTACEKAKNNPPPERKELSHHE